MDLIAHAARPYTALTSWLLRRYRVVFAAVLFYALAAFAIDRLVGGYLAFLTGTILFMVIVVYAFLIVVLFVFQPYSGEIGRVMASPAARVVGIILCTGVAVVAIWSLAITSARILNHAV